MAATSIPALSSVSIAPRRLLPLSDKALIRGSIVSMILRVILSSMESFAVEPIRYRWCAKGHKEYPRAKRLLITAPTVAAQTVRDRGYGNGNFNVRPTNWSSQFPPAISLLAQTSGIKSSITHFPS
jgi:hypothetical protein